MSTTPREHSIATEVADALNDHKSFSLHLSYARFYTEDSIYENLKIALSTPGIRNRAAYYNSLMQRNGVPKKKPRN
jgi:hypothetical protein